MSAAESSNPDPSTDWRKSVSQAYRTSEVRSIAPILASVEPGATADSKKMLAMKFEDAIFQNAKSLEDYKKTIQKRLNKVKKHYAKMQAEAGAADGAGGSGGGGGGAKGGASGENAQLIREKELLLERELKETYGARLLYIVKYADAAVEATREKHGDARADVLMQHANNAKTWAGHLGLSLPSSSSEGDKNSSAKQQDTPDRSMAFLTKLKSYLESRVENIRSHIVKIIDPDLFLEETLGKLDTDLFKPNVSSTLQSSLVELDGDKPVFSKEHLERLLEKMNAPVPIPRRNQEGDGVKAAIARIEKVRAAANALYTYIGLNVGDKTEFAGCMNQCHKVVMECVDVLDEEYSKLVKELEDADENGERMILLEDAWNHPLVLKEDEEEEQVEDGEEAVAVDSESGVEPTLKRAKTEDRPRRPVVIRSRLLLTPGRHTFPTLIPQLRRKKAKLVRNNNGTTSPAFVKLVFGKAFEMTIYFVPLLVTIRAMESSGQQQQQQQQPHDASQEYAPTVSLAGGLRWPSLYHGLRPSAPAASDASTISKQTGGSSITTSSASKHGNLSVLGVTGPAIGHIIAKKLEYASSQATYVLRRCFADTTVGKGALAKTEYEIELLETGALIRFLTIARNTYNPGWVDAE